MRRRRALLVLLTLALALAACVAACSGGGEAREDRSTAAASDPTEPGSAASDASGSSDGPDGAGRSEGSEGSRSAESAGDDSEQRFAPEHDAPLEPLDVAIGFALALALGLLLGLEREKSARADQEATFGGARTFPLVALLGAASSLATHALGPWALLPPLALVGALMLLAYQAQVRSEPERRGLTTEISAIFVFAIGALPFLEGLPLDFRGRLVTSAALGAVALALLALREPIHGFASRLSEQDVFASVRFILLAVVLLPLLPDVSYGPFDTLNPFRLGVVVVLIAAISYLGYVAVRVLGPRRGIGATGLFGGLASSTAVALTFSRRGRESPRLALACALAIVLASTIMVPRVGLEVFVIERPLLSALLAPLGAMLGVGLVGSAVLWRRAGRHESNDESPAFENPFELSEALKLGALYAVIRVVAAAANEWFGEAGLYGSAALAGLTDVDAITISIARMHGAEEVASGTAAVAIVIAAVSNTLVKGGIAVALGGRRLGLAVCAVLVPAAIAGVAVAVIAR